MNRKLLESRARSALRALFVADSLAMPVHWYYRVSDIYKEFPNGITGLEEAPQFHPSSIMSMHSTQQGGRKDLNSKNKSNIIGGVILKGKESLWGQANQHYHHGMKAGENTLNAYCARVLMQTLIENKGHYDVRQYLENYVSMMTADKPLHNDTYAESYHRGFFANYVAGSKLEDCAAVTHDTPSIGGLVSIAPLAISLLLSGYDLEEVQKQCQKHLYLTHPDEFLAQVCFNYVNLIQALLFRTSDKGIFELLVKTLNKSVKFNFSSLTFNQTDDKSIVGGMFSTACYITDSWPSLLFLAGKYQNNIEAGLLANSNLGGDNVHRGAVLGIILGLINDDLEKDRKFMGWYTSLVDYSVIESEIDYLINIFKKNIAHPLL